MGRKHGATRRRQKAKQPSRRRRAREYREYVAQAREDGRQVTAGTERPPYVVGRLQTREPT